MSQTNHNLNIVVTQTGLDQVSQATDNFVKSTSGLVTQQDALTTAFGKTQGAAFKTGQEFSKTEKEITNTGKASTATSKTTETLGSAFKSSALQITAFASGLISTIGQLVSYQKSSASLERQDAILEKRWLSLSTKQKQLALDIKNGSISTEEAARKTKEYEIQQKALEAQTELVSAKHQQQTLTLMNLATTVLPTVLNGVSSLNNIYGTIKGSLDSATQATAETSAETANLGTVADTTQTIGIIPMLKNFAAWVTGSQDVNKQLTDLSPVQQKLTQDTTAMADTGNIVVRAFKEMGSGAKEFASNIKTEIGGATGFVDKFKAGFMAFFSGLRDGFVALGGHLKDAGKAFLDFGKAIVGVFTAHPILLIIGAIATAVAALVFDLGGFRTRMNEIGVAVGKAVPALKPLLDGLGWLSDQLGKVGDAIMGTSSTMDKMAVAANRLALATDADVQALNKVLDVGGDLQQLDYIIKLFDDITAATNNFTTQLSQNHITWVAGTEEYQNKFIELTKAIKDKSPDVQNAINAITNTLEILKKGGYDAGEATTMLNALMEVLKDRLFEAKEAAVPLAQAEIDLATQIDMATNSLTAEGVAVKNLFEEFSDAEVLANEFAKAVITNNYDLIASWGLEEEQLKELFANYKKEFPNGAMIVQQFGESVVVSLDTIKERLGATSKDISTFVSGVEKEIKPAIDLLTDSFVKATKAVTDLEREQQLEIDINRIAAAEISKNSLYFAQAVDAMVQKYKDLGVTHEQVADMIVKKEDEIAKAKEKETKETDKQIEKAKSLAQTRQEEIAADNALVASAESLIASLGRQVEVQGMTGQGLQKLIDIQDDTINAYRLAADSVGLWYAELGKSQAVEEQERAVLVKLAHDHGVTLPDAIINGSIQAMKDYIAEATGMADTSEEAAQRINDAIDSIAEKSQSGLEDLIKEDLIKGDLDEVIEKLEETGRSIDQLSVQQILIKPLLETQEFDDDLESLSEMLGSKWGEEQIKSKEGANEVMQSYFDGLRESHGEEVEPLISTMDQMWSNLNTMYPEKTATELMDIFFAAMDKPSEMQKILSGVAAAGAKGFESGGHLFKTAGEKAWYELIVGGDPVRAEAYAKGHEIGGNVPKGAAAGIKNESGTAAEEMRNMGVTMIGQLNLVLNNEVTVTLPGFVTLFGKQFAAMGETVANFATTASPHFETINTNIITLQTTFSALSTNIATYSTSMANNIANWLLATSEGFQNYQTIIVAVQETFSNLSLNIATYATSMTANIAEWILQTSEGFQNYQTIILAVQETFSNLSLNVDTYTDSMTTNIAEWLLQTSQGFEDYQIIILALQETFSNLSSNVETYTDSMTKNIQGFATDSTTAFGEVDESLQLNQTNTSSTMNVWNAAMDEMSNKVESFADACETAFEKVQTAAEDATTAVEDLQSAIDKLKDKTITITVKYKTEGSPGARFGGSTIVGYARSGDSWIQDTPTTIGGMKVSEGSKPELITVTPLSNPWDMSDKTINVPVATPQIPAASMMQQGGQGGNQPITVTGDLYVRVETQSGETLAKEVKPFLLKGFSGIT